MKDGGPAFPVPLFESKDGALISGYDGYGLGGMSLRDYFAAKAMPALIMEDSNIDATNESIAQVAYKIADAMLAEREKK